MATQLYCVISSTACLSMSEWKDLASIVGTIVAVPGVLFAAYKTLREVRSSREQRERELRLKRTEFTLAQHRRLFDDPALLSVMRVLDEDNVSLSDVSMWEPKRKFLTFFEELILLVNSGYIKRETALYMFGYYAKCAHRSKNFLVGIDYSPEYWSLFMAFAEEAEQYLASYASKDIATLEL